MAINIPNTQIPQTQGMPSLGRAADWYQMGPGTLGDLAFQLENSMRNRNAMQEEVTGMDIGLRKHLDPMLVSEMGLQQNVNQALNTPRNVDILAGGQLGQAQELEARGRTAQGMVPYNLGKAGLEYEGLTKVRDLQGKFDAVNEAFTLGNVIGGNSLHPMLPQWKQAVGKVAEVFGHKPGSPEYEQAVSEWAIPSEATLGTFDRVAKNIALRRDEHMRAVDLANIKGKWGVDEAEARNVDKGYDTKEKVAQIRAISSDLNKLRDARRTILLQRNTARLQLRTVLANIADPKVRAETEADYLADYDNQLIRLDQEIKATKAMLSGVDAASPLLYDDETAPDKGGRDVPKGKLTPVQEPSMPVPPSFGAVGGPAGGPAVGLGEPFPGTLSTKQRDTARRESTPVTTPRPAAAVSAPSAPKPSGMRVPPNMVTYVNKEYQDKKIAFDEAIKLLPQPTPEQAKILLDLYGDVMEPQTKQRLQLRAARAF